MNTFEKLLTALALVSNAPGSELASESFARCSSSAVIGFCDHAVDLLEHLGDGRRGDVGPDARRPPGTARRCGGT